MPEQCSKMRQVFVQIYLISQTYMHFWRSKPLASRFKYSDCLNAKLAQMFSGRMVRARSIVLKTQQWRNLVQTLIISICETKYKRSLFFFFLHCLHLSSILIYSVKLCMCGFVQRQGHALYMYIPGKFVSNTSKFPLRI